MNINDGVIKPCFFLILSLSLFLGQPAPAQSDQDLEYLKSLSRQTTFFAEQEYSLILDKGRDCWPDADTLKVRMVFANKTVFEKNFPAKFPLKVDFQYPQLKPGVIADPLLIITAFSQEEMLKGIYQKQLFFFPQKQSPAPGLYTEEIGIFDQTGEGLLKNSLQEMGIPFTEIYEFSDFNGPWIVGSGLDFSNNYSLFEEMLEAFSKGTSLLILAPLEGEFPWPDMKKITRVIFSDESIVADYDKHLNLLTDGMNGTEGHVTFQVGSNGESSVIKCTGDRQGYNWLEFQTPESRMIFLGWNLPAYTGKNPTMFMLLNRILTQEEKK